MKSKRDQCFDDAVEVYNQKTTGPKLKVEYNVCWMKDLAKTGSKWRAVGQKIFKHSKHIINHAKKSYGFANPVWRFPDLTIVAPNKSLLVIDNKFKGDRFYNRRGRSKKTQWQDYRKINREQGFTKVKPALTPEACGCGA